MWSHFTTTLRLNVPSDLRHARVQSENVNKYCPDTLIVEEEISDVQAMRHIPGFITRFPKSSRIFTRNHLGVLADPSHEISPIVSPLLFRQTSKQIEII